jgi:hypothetical protein
MFTKMASIIKIMKNKLVILNKTILYLHIFFREKKIVVNYFNPKDIKKYIG